MSYVSLELIPKLDGDTDKLLQVARSFRAHAGFVSVTCTKNDFALTLDVCLRLMDEGYNPAAHVLCGSRTRKELKEQIRVLGRHGIRNVVALRGDRTRDDISPSESCDTIEFVGMLKDSGHFDQICVAGYPNVHPDATDPLADHEFLLRKIEAGATRVITQVCFEETVLGDFRDRLVESGVRVPVSAGLLPIRSYERTLLFAKRCRAPVPQGVRDAFEGTPVSGHRELAKGLLSDLTLVMVKYGMDIHYYSLNSVKLVNEAVRALEEARSAAAAAQAAEGLSS